MHFVELLKAAALAPSHHERHSGLPRWPVGDRKRGCHKRQAGGEGTESEAAVGILQAWVEIPVLLPGS